MEYLWTDPAGQKLSATIAALLLCWFLARRCGRMGELKTQWKAAIPHSREPQNCRQNADHYGLMTGMYSLGVICVLMLTLVMWIWL